ncbi:putative ribonuclease H-like domain-containing protein [Tanacetum coccineum]
MAPRAVLMKTALKSFNTARPVITVRSVNTGRPFSTARPFRSTVNTVRARGFNAVKPSACWVWRPIKPNGASLSNSQLNDKGFVDSGCSRHMTGNIAHLLDFKDFDGGYVTFGGGACGGRITGKGFEDPDHPDKVYNVVKALYGLHQAPRAWYDTLANYLLCNGFQRGKIDQTLFIKRQKGHILLVQIYVDDIIFGSTKKELCDEFEKLMKDKFQMSSMGELTFFLGLQVQQKKKGIFISQDKYVNEILRKYNYTDVKSASTPTDLEKPLVQDGDAADVDEHLYRSMIGSLMYLTASRPDIMFAVCACARFQVSPKTSHLLAVKRIFRYLKGKPSLGLWYSKDSPLELVAYTDSDYAGATQDRKSTTGGCQFLGNRLISWQCKKQTVVATSTTEAEYVAAASCCGQVYRVYDDLALFSTAPDWIVMQFGMVASYFLVTASLKIFNYAQTSYISTGSREVSTALPEVNTATPEDLVGPSPASEDSHVEDQEIELGNIPQSYAVPTTPHIRIHKDHLIEHVIGDVQSSVQTRRKKQKKFYQALRDPA